jgi:hypothetical protein
MLVWREEGDCNMISSCRRLPFLLGVTAFLASSLASGSAQAAQPAKGTYVGYHQRISATPSCAIQTGATWTAYFWYPGPLKTGAETRQEYDVPTGNALLQLLAYPVTPAAGITTWSGTLVETTLPASTTVTKSFSIAFTFGDAKSWLWDRIVVDGSCTAEDKIVLVHTGS